MALPVTIGGASKGFSGPFKSAAGAFYVVARTISGNVVRVYKSSATPNDAAWGAVTASITVSNTGTGTGGSTDAIQDGNILHVATCLPDATTATSTRIHYHKFDMASETWTLSNEAVDGPTATSATTGGDYRSVCIVRRSASVVIAYQMASVLSMSANYSRVGYRERTDAAGTWGAGVAIDALGTAQTSAVHIGAVKDPQSDRVHFHWYEGSSLRVRTLSAANVFNTASTTAVGTVSTVSPPKPLAGTGYVSGGVSKIVIAKASAGATTTMSGVYFNSADNPTVNAASGTLPGASSTTIHRNYSDNGKAYFLYFDAGLTLRIGESADHGATWTGFTINLATSITASTAECSTNGGQVYVRGSSYVIAYVFNDGGAIKYNEYVVRAAAPAEINVTTGAQTTLSTTQSATGDIDLAVTAAQATLATTQAGTISAQAALAVTGAQSTLAASQSAAADVDVKLTGSQTLSAPATAATASLSLSVTGAQATLAATQAALADVDLAVSGAQTTNATTQSATASAAVRNVTAAQATLATTQTATAGVRLTVTGAQTLSAPTQSAAADVDLAVTGAQATLATSQAGTVGARLTVTGAQTLSTVTQTATASVRLAVTTGAQTTNATTQSAIVLVTDVRLVVGNQTTNAATSTGSISISTQTKTLVRHAGVWKQATPYVRHAGVWKAATIHVKQAGTWKRA